MSPGRSCSHWTGLGCSVTEFSKGACWCWVELGTSPPVAFAMAYRIAVRTWSFPVAIVNSWKSGLASLFSCQKQPRTLPSEVAIGGGDLPALVDAGKGATTERT